MKRRPAPVKRRTASHQAYRLRHRPMGYADAVRRSLWDRIIGSAGK